MKDLKIHNTLTRSLEDFFPQSFTDNNKVKIYHCGPTVYWTQHIGNMRAMYFGDIVRRTLKYLDYEPIYVRNYTDVGHLDGDNAGDADSGEDRMEKGAQREGLTVWEIAEKYIQQFDQDVAELGNLELNEDYSTPEPFKNRAVRATKEIEEQIQMVKALLDKKFAYITEEAVYFDVLKAQDYTRLTGQKIDMNIAGAGHGDADAEDKRNAQDFVIWFFRQGQYKNHSMHWNTLDQNGIARFYTETNPDGDGFPGWHLECSSMAKKYLGNTLDIHIGGVEHIPVHHTNEIAQSESANGEPFVKYWLHYEHLLVDGSKMSKSGGTAFTLADLHEKGFTGLDLRYFFLNAHYRSQQNFTWEALNAAKSGYENLKKKFLFIKNEISDIADQIKDVNWKPELYEQEEFDGYLKDFEIFISNDFNTSEALSLIWSILKEDIVSSQSKYKLILKFDDVLGLQLETESEKFNKKIDISDEIQKLITLRNEAKQNKDYKKSDEIREEINKFLAGTDFKLADNADGSTKLIKN